MYNKIIFLDIDGVLNSDHWSKTFINRIRSGTVENGENNQIDPNAVKLLYNLCKQENIGLVISSSWRGLTVDDTKNDFDHYTHLSNLNEFIIGITPRSKDRFRGNEIQSWLEHYKDNDYVSAGLYIPGTLSDPFSFCILDDDTDMLDSQGMNFINVSNITGITENTIGQVHNLLSRHDIMWTNIK